MEDDVIRVQKRLSALVLARMKRKYRSNLLFALNDTPPPPCTTCIHWQRCAEKYLACLAFKRYVSGGASPRTEQMEPNRQIYAEIYGADE
jgi:hypothetical protein